MKKLFKTSALLFFLGMGLSSFAQTSVTGNVTDLETGESLIGANILVENTVTGTITDLDGSYTLVVNKEAPFNLIYSLVGYGTKTMTVTANNQVVDVALSTQSILADEIVVSASRIEENILQSPVSIEKINLQQLKATAAADFYDEISNLKGVVSTAASMTFNTVNTRGFATGGNTRFVQLQDGIDNAAPLLNFPTGNVVGISELDIKSVELVPGAASALYGPNAFNGILFMESKDPWSYQGLSAQLKTGIADGFDATTSSDSRMDPLYGASIRYAKSINDKFAYKFNISTFFAQDWRADNYVQHRPNYDDNLGVINAGNQAFDGVNLYGDEALIPVADTVTRTGFRESDLLDNHDAKSIKLDAALHYRLNDNIEANVSYKWGSGSSVYQGAERYALRNFIQQFAKFELNSNNWNVRAYGSFTDDGDSYNLSALGAFANENLFESAITLPGTNTVVGGWAAAYSQAFNGAFGLFGIPGNNHNAAREFADGGGFALLTPNQLNAVKGTFPPDLADIIADAFTGNSRLGPDGNLSPEALAAIKEAREGLFQRGGAGFIDNSRMYHVEGNYDLSDKLNDVIGLQVGGNFRQYGLFTDGTIFRETNPETGENERIIINEWGAYTQVSKELMDKLKLTGSIRYDKNQNFKGQISPRISAVYSIDEKKRHNIRTSWQTGFRNPTTQGQYIFFPATTLLLGGTKENADIPNELDGEIYNIFEDGALALDGVTEVDLDYVEPENLTSFEIGYKGIIGSKLFLDVNYYRNNYKNFISQLRVLSTRDVEYLGNRYPKGDIWFPYTNVPIDFNSNGVDLGTRYRLDKNWSIEGNYSFAKVNFDDTKLVGTSFEGSGFDPGFNTPEHKMRLGFSSKNIIKNLGFGVNMRWQDEFLYNNAFARGTIPAYATIDASISYNIPSVKTLFKLGVTNLLKEDYITNIGNPRIGRMFVLTMTYDQFAN